MLRMILLVCVTLLIQMLSAQNIEDLDSKTDDQESTLFIDFQLGVTTNLLMRDFNLAAAAGKVDYVPFSGIPITNGLGIKKTLPSNNFFIGVRGIFTRISSRNNQAIFNLNSYIASFGYEHEFAENNFITGSVGAAINSARFQLIEPDHSSEIPFGQLLTTPDRMSINTTFSSLIFSLGTRHNISQGRKFNSYLSTEIIYGFPLPPEDDFWFNNGNKVVNGPRVTQYPLSFLVGFGFYF
jgi:hypothetical protein